jgi:hypothetical protein
MDEINHQTNQTTKEDEGSTVIADKSENVEELRQQIAEVSYIHGVEKDLTPGKKKKKHEYTVHHCIFIMYMSNVFN